MCNLLRYKDRVLEPYADWEFSEVRIKPPTRFKVAPSEPVPVIKPGRKKRKDDDGDKPSVTMMNFGLVSARGRQMMARGETVERLPMFREAFRTHRCLVLVNGFYDSLDMGVKRGPKVQYRALQEFRSNLKMRGLVEVYETTQGFAEKLKRQLDRKLNDGNTFKGASDFFLASPDSTGSNSEPSNAVEIGDSALDLLQRASNSDGIIATLTKSDGSLHLQIGNDVMDTSSPRLGAKWRSAIEELFEEGFLRDINGKHEIFELNYLAYTYCDSLKSSGGLAEKQRLKNEETALRFPGLRLNLQYYIGKSWLTGNPGDPRNNKWTIEWEKLLVFITNVGAPVSISDVSFSVNGKKVNAQLGPLLPQFVETNHTLPGQEYLLGPGALANLPGMNPKIVVETSCGHTVEFDPKLFYEMKPMHGSDVVQLPQPPASSERSEPEQGAP